MIHKPGYFRRAAVPTLVALWLIWSFAGPSAAVLAATPVTTVFVSSTDGLVRSVVVSGPGKGTQTIVGSTGVGLADSLLFEPSGKLIVTGLGFPDIYRVDPTKPGGAANTGTQVNTTPLSGTSADPAIDAAGTNVYVTNFGNAVNVINRTTGAVTIHTLPGMSLISGISFDAAGQLWVTDFVAHTVGIANLTLNTYTPLCTGIALGGGGPDGLSFDASSGKLYVSGQANNTITQMTIGTGTCAVSHVFTLTNSVNPDGIAADGLGGIFMSGQTGTLERLDTATSAEDVIATGISGLDDIAPASGLGAPPSAPSCNLTGVIAGPPKQIQITAQDTGSGLQSIVVTESINATTVVPTFTAGTTSPVVVTSTKINQSAASTVALRVTDLAGNVTNCDPALLSVGSQPGMPRTQTVHHVAKGESDVTIYNGTPGLTRLALVVDGKRLEITGLQDGEQRQVDVSSLMRRGSNTVTIIAQGKPGGSATVLLTD